MKHEHCSQSHTCTEQGKEMQNKILPEPDKENERTKTSKYCPKKEIKSYSKKKPDLNNGIFNDFPVRLCMRWDQGKNIYKPLKK